MAKCSIFIQNENETITCDPGQRLLTVCDEQPCAILFGCRDGLCGTCLIEVEDGMANLSAVEEDEAEMLDAMAEGNDKARLACQCVVSGDATVTYIGG